MMKAVKAFRKHAAKADIAAACAVDPEHADRLRDPSLETGQVSSLKAPKGDFILSRWLLIFIGEVNRRKPLSLMLKRDEADALFAMRVHDVVDFEREHDNRGFWNIVGLTHEETEELNNLIAIRL